MSEDYATRLAAQLNKIAADGQHRTGTAARACCPADQPSVIRELTALLQEERGHAVYFHSIQHRYQRDFYAKRARALAHAITALRHKPARGPAGNI